MIWYHNLNPIIITLTEVHCFYLSFLLLSPILFLSLILSFTPCRSKISCRSLPGQPIPLQKSRGKREPRFLLPFSGLLAQIPYAHPVNRRDRPCFPQATRLVAPFCLFSRAIPKTWKVYDVHMTSRVRTNLMSWECNYFAFPFLLIKCICEGGKEGQRTSNEKSRRSWPGLLPNKRELSRRPIVISARRKRADIREDPLFPTTIPDDCRLGKFYPSCNRIRLWSVSWRIARPKLISKQE